MVDFLANHTRKEEHTSLQLLIFYQPFGVIDDLLYHDLLSIYKSRIVNPVTLHYKYEYIILLLKKKNLVWA